MKKNPFSVLWYEGMALEPQIFQQEFLYNEESREYFLKYATPYSWGVINLELETTYLAEGILRVKNLEAILPDFSRIIFPYFNDDSLEIKLADKKDELSKDELFVFLAVPVDCSTQEKNTINPRYEAKEIENVADFNISENLVTVSYMKPRYFLYVGKTGPERHIALPLAKIHFTGVEFQLVEYSPPSFSIKNSDMLINKLSDLVSSGRDKLKYLLNQTGEKAQRANSMMINLAQIIMPLEQTLKAGETPYNLFKILVNSIAHALAFYKGTTLPMAPEYDHTDYLKSILPLIEFVELSFENVKETYKQYKFDESDDLFGIALKQIQEECEHIYVGMVINEKSTTEKTIAWAKSAIVATENHFDKVQDQRILGPNREIVKYIPELELSEQEDMILVKIECSPTFITEGEVLCIMNLSLEDARPKNLFLFTPN